MNTERLETIEIRGLTTNTDNHTIVVECQCKKMSRPFTRRTFKYETFADNVISKAFTESDKFRVLLDHDRNQVIGTKSNSKLTETPYGFKLEVRLANTEKNRDLLGMIETMPDLVSCSFGFIKKADEIKNGVRTVKAIELREISVLIDKESQYESQLVDLRELESQDDTLYDDLLNIYKQMYEID